MENLKFLNEQDAQSLEGEINEIECQAAIQSMKLNKSPGAQMEFLSNSVKSFGKT